MLRKILDFAHANGWLLLPVEVNRLVLMRLRALIYRSSLKRSDLSLGSRPYIRGTRYIQIGSRFSAGSDLWLEAIHRYEGCTFTPQILIGNNVNVSDAVHIAATTAVYLGDGVLVGSRVIITDHNHGNYSGIQQDGPSVRPAKRPLTSGRRVIIEDNVWIGDGVVVLAGVTIGEGSIIAANAVVSRDIPPACIAAGAPALPIKKYDSNAKCWKRCALKI